MEEEFFPYSKHLVCTFVYLLKIFINLGEQNLQNVLLEEFSSCRSDTADKSTVPAPMASVLPVQSCALDFKQHRFARYCHNWSKYGWAVFL